MNHSTAVMLINPNIRAIHVIYEPDVIRQDGTVQTKHQRYMFKTVDQSIKIGQYVVIPTDTRHGMTVALVTDVDVDVDFESNTPIKWIIDKVNVETNRQILAEEQKWIEQIKESDRLAKQEELKKKMFAMYDKTELKALPIAQIKDPGTGNLVIEHKRV